MPDRISGAELAAHSGSWRHRRCVLARYGAPSCGSRRSRARSILCMGDERTRQCRVSPNSSVARASNAFEPDRLGGLRNSDDRTSSWAGSDRTAGGRSWGCCGREHIGEIDTKYRWLQGQRIARSLTSHNETKNGGCNALDRDWDCTGNLRRSQCAWCGESNVGQWSGESDGA